ncbi:MAG: RnfABCDGE type electron transport complex subunit B [Acutalibacteraceae bacterium]
MNPILLAVIIVAAIGLIVGLVLAVASVILAVPKDEKAEAVLAALPGANCGACGFSGCSGYAAALAHGKAELGLCSPGGEETVKAVAQILGQEASNTVKTTAIVSCKGSLDNTQSTVQYQGITTCKAAMQLHGGTKACSYGCIGFGDCVSVCEYDAVKVCNGVAMVDESRCKACKKCVAACPKGLISIVPIKPQAVVLCSNCDKGAQTRKDCKAGCIGCMKCVKVCPTGAVTVNKFHAAVNPELCTGCFECVNACPQRCISKKFV